MIDETKTFKFLDDKTAFYATINLNSWDKAVSYLYAQGYQPKLNVPYSVASLRQKCAMFIVKNHDEAEKAILGFEKTFETITVLGEAWEKKAIKLALRVFARDKYNSWLNENFHWVKKYPGLYKRRWYQLDDEIQS